MCSSDLLQFYNIIVRKCLQILNFEELGRQFYDRHQAIQMPHQRLELWPGYLTTMRNYENSLMLNVEVTHKVLRLDNCLSIISGLRAAPNQKVEKRRPRGPFYKTPLA